MTTDQDESRRINSRKEVDRQDSSGEKRPEDTGESGKGTQSDPTRGEGGDGGNNGNGGGSGGDGSGGPTSDPTPPSDEELRLLAFLWFVEQRIDDDVSGFQSKRLFEETVSEHDSVGELYARLKGEYITNRRDADPVALTQKGKLVARDAADAQEEVIDHLLTAITHRTSHTELLQRLLWVASADSEEFEWYFEQHEEELDETATLLAQFLPAERFQSHPAFGSVLDSLPDIESRVRGRVTDLLESSASLKGLAVLEGQAVIELLDIDIVAHSRVGTPQEVLTHYVDAATADDVLAELAYEGLGREHNAFRIGVDALLEQHRDELQEWLSFDQPACRELFENNWELVVPEIEGRNYNALARALTKQLTDVGALVPSSGRLAVRSETQRASKDVLSSLQKELEDRLNRFTNVTSQVSLDIGEARDCAEDIVVTLHAYSWSSNQHSYPAFVDGTSSQDPEKNLLTDKIVLVPSPREFGFQDPHLDSSRYNCYRTAVERPNINQEFNAIGPVSGLDDIKAEFDRVEWEQVDNYRVERVERFLKEASQISTEEAFDALADHDAPYIVALYAITAKRTTGTSLRRNDYNETVLWNDVKETLLTRYDSLSEAEFEEIRATLEEILVERAGIDLIEFDDSDAVHDRFGDRLEADIEHHINGMTVEEKQILYTHLSNERDGLVTQPSGSQYQSTFDLRFQFLFGDEPATDQSLGEILVESGVCTAATYVMSDGERHKEQYPLYVGLEDRIDKFLPTLDIESRTVSLGSLEQYEESVPQLAGIEYLLKYSGHGVPRRSNFRDALLSLDDDAMREFEFLDGIVAEQGEYVMFNPAIVSDLEEWVTERKQALMVSYDDIVNRIGEANCADLNLHLDEEKNLYEGVILTKERDEVQVVIAPWLTASDLEWIERNAVIVLTEEYSAEFIEERKGGYQHSLILTIADNGVDVYRNLPHDEISEPIIRAFKQGYGIRNRAVDVGLEQAEPDSEQITDELSDSDLESDQSDEDVEATGTTEPSAEVGLSDSELPQKIFESKGGSFPTNLVRDRPVVLLLHKPEDDRFATTLQLICRELYRQYEGGTPRGRIRDNPDETERRVKAGGRIEFIDETDGRFFRTGESSDGSPNSVNWTRISHRIQELDTQGFGFLIFQLPTDFVATFREDLNENVRPHRPQLYELEPRLPRGEYSSTESYLQRAVPTAEALWGYPDLQSQFERFEGWPRHTDCFDDVFAIAEQQAWQYIQDTATEPIDGGDTERSPRMVVNRHQSGDAGPSAESSLHYSLKVHVVRWLVESKGFEFDSIDTETDTQVAKDTNQGIVPDVQAGRAVYEVETLYGTGMPTVSVKETVEKYRDVEGSTRVNIVLPPIGAFLHYRSLKELGSEINEQWDVRVSFLIPFLRENSVVGIENLQGILE